MKEHSCRHHHEDLKHCGHSCGCHNHEHSESKEMLLRVIIGGVIFISGFFIKEPVYIPVFILSYIILAKDIFINSATNLSKGHIFDENTLMTIASIGAFAIGSYHEAVAVILFYQIGELLQHRAVEKSRHSITELMDIRPDYANVQRNGKIIKLSPTEVYIGDIILVYPGERIPLDGEIISGEAYLDTMALTGESIPVKVCTGDKVLSGSVCSNSPLKIEVKKEFKESTASKILDMIQYAQAQKTQSERFITKFARYYTPAVVALAVLIMLIPSLITHDFKTWIYRGLLFLVVSCPCALVVSVPLGFFAGIGCSSKNGILIKGSNYLEALSRLDTVVFDKTGTLTNGEFKVNEIFTQLDKSEFLELAAYAEYYSSHPIAVSIKQAYEKDINENKIKNYREISGMGISAEIDGKTILLGNRRLINDAPDSVYNAVFMSINGEYVGYIVVSDTLKSDSQYTISKLKEAGINTIILTGDNQKNADFISTQLGIDTVYSQLLPQNKVCRIEDIINNKSKKSSVAFVGDGINDAPVLARADIGIAMGGLGSDSAIEAADLVIMTDEPSKILTAIKISNKTMRIVRENIILALTVKIIILILSAMGLTNMWLAIFGDVGVTLIAVLNSLRGLHIKSK